VEEKTSGRNCPDVFLFHNMFEGSFYGDILSQRD